MNRLQLAMNAINKTLTSKSWSLLYSESEETAERVLQKPYSKSSIVYTCISTTARAISQVPLVVMQKSSNPNQIDELYSRKGLNIDTGINTRRYVAKKYLREPLYVIERGMSGNVDLWEQVEESHPWQKVLNYPNYLMSGQKLKEAIIGHLMLDGNVWILGMPLSISVTPDTLWVIKKKHMAPKKDKRTGHILYWEYNPKASDVYSIAIDDMPKIQIDLKERIAHMKLWNPDDPVMGLSPLEPGGVSMKGDWKAAIYNDKLFDNDGTPGGTLETDQQLSPVQVEQMRSQWNQEHQGYRKSHRLGILHKGLKYHQTAAMPRDMQHMEFREYSRDDIMRILGMKKAVISITESLNYATALGQKKEWWESTNIPLGSNAEGAMNTGLLKNDPNLKIMFDYSSVKALQEDFTEKINQAKNLWSMGLPFDIINQRLELGFDKIPGGDTGWLPFGLAPVSGAQNELPPAEEPPPELPPPDDEEPIPEEDQEIRINLLEGPKNIEVKAPQWEVKAEMIWKKVDNQVRRIEEPFMGKLRRIFFEMRRNILSILHTGAPAKSTKVVLIKAAVDINLDEINEYNFLKERMLLEKSAVGFFDLGITEGATLINDELGIGDLISMNDPLVMAYVTAKKTKIVSVIDTVKKQIVNEIHRGILEGEDTTLIEKRIKGVFGKADRRAHVIARTEIGGAFNFGRYAQINRSSYKLKIWFTALDERVRGADPDEKIEFDHTVMHGEKIQISDNSKWRVPGLRGDDYIDYPGDYKGQPGNIIQCRCIEVVDTESL